MKKRKITFLVLTILLSAGIFSCGRQNASSENSSEAVRTEAADSTATETDSEPASVPETTTETVTEEETSSPGYSEMQDSGNWGDLHF